MKNVEFGLSMTQAWKELLKGNDIYLYRKFEGDDSTMDDAKNKIYKYNWRIFVILMISSLFLSYILWIVLFTFIWYKPVCHMFHLKNRVKRLNIHHFAEIKGLNNDY